MDLHSIVMENLEVYVSGFVVIGGALAYYFQQKKSKKPTQAPPTEAPVVKPTLVPKVSWTDRLTLGLATSRSEVWGKIGQLFAGEKPHLDEIEEVLYTADIPTAMVQELLGKLEKDGKGKSSTEISQLVYSF